jgi:transcriptional antiterminator NusG
MSKDQWFAIRVKSNRESVCSVALEGRGYEVFLPQQVLQKSEKKKKTTTYPLFPGYLFCRFDCECRLPVLTVPGIVHIVGIGKRPHPIEDEEIESLRVVVQTGLPMNANAPYTIGGKVRINQGPLTGVVGIVSGTRTKNDGEPTLIVSITLLQRSVAVAFPQSWLQSIEPEIANSARQVA